jgi:predicted nucleotidyltransferase
LIAELNNDNVSAIGLTGSHARGAATPYSDIDIYLFVNRLPEDDHNRYQLRRLEGHLVSITTTTIRIKRDDLTRPETIIWTVPGLRQMRILLDKHGELKALKNDVKSFNWRLFQPAADAYVSRKLMEYAEEVHKLLGGLSRNDESAMIYATYGLVLGLAQIAAVERGLMIESENRYFQQVQNLYEADSDWTRIFRVAAGLTTAINGEPISLSLRAFCALNLYTLTVQTLRDIIMLEHAEIIYTSIEAIESLEYFSRQNIVSLTGQKYLPTSEIY